MQLTGKIALITGAASGIGRASARRFAVEGARVVVADRDADGGTATVAAIQAAGGTAMFVPVDVASEASVAAAFERVDATWGRLDLVFANAGILAADDLPVEQLTEAAFDRVTGVNLKGPLWTCKHAIPRLRAAGGGAMLLTASVGGVKAGRATAYNLTKAAVIHLTHCLAVQYAPDKIRVNCLLPGGTATNLMAEVNLARGRPAGAPGQMANLLDRPADPAEIAAAALFLLSDAASYITGAALPVDGGTLLV